MDSLWELPQQAMYWRRLASFSRLIAYDRRGVGDSDPIPSDHELTLDDEVADAITVLDTLGVGRTAVLTNFFGGPVAIGLAARNPERVSHLVLFGTYARWSRAADHPIGMPEETLGRYLEWMEKSWGLGSTIDFFVPSLSADDTLRAHFARQERAGASPRQVVNAMSTWSRYDARPHLSEIRVPTLVLHPAGDLLVQVSHGRHLAGHIRNARYIELPGQDHVPVGDELEPVAGAIEEFITGTVSSRLGERVLAAVLFVDVSHSTEHAARLGDRSWKEVLDVFREIARRELARHDGREVNTRGDDLLAEFALPAKAIAFAAGLRGEVRSLGLEVRAGIHLGEVERQGDDLAGIAVHVGARIGELAGANEILVSQTVHDVVIGSGFGLADRGEHDLKGVPGKWRVFAVSG
ncbi:MAG: adenylate/guanylate cyclase domain-containing protein [Actinomycetota bacterium]